MGGMIGSSKAGSIGRENTQEFEVGAKYLESRKAQEDSKDGKLGMSSWPAGWDFCFRNAGEC